MFVLYLQLNGGSSHHSVFYFYFNIYLLYFLFILFLLQFQAPVLVPVLISWAVAAPEKKFGKFFLG